MSSGFSQQQMINIFERIACVTPPRQFYISQALPEIKFGGKRCVKKMREMVVDCLRLQKLITFQGQLAQLVEEYERIAEVWVFKAEIELALMKPDISLQTVNDALRKKAEPQEMLRDVHLIISSYLNKAKKTSHKPVIIRKPRNDPFSKIYQPDEGQMEEIELLLAYLLGGPAVFDFEALTGSQSKDTKKQPGKQNTQKKTLNIQQNTAKPLQTTTQKAPTLPQSKQLAETKQQPQLSKQPSQIQNNTKDDEPLYQKPSGQTYNILDDLQKKKQQKMQEKIQDKSQDPYHGFSEQQNDYNQTGNQLVEFMKKKNLQRSYVQVAQQQQTVAQQPTQNNEQQEVSIQKQQKEIQNILDMVEVEFKNPATLSEYNVLQQQGLVPTDQQNGFPEIKTVTFKENLVESGKEDDKPKSAKIGLYQKIREFVMPDVENNEYEELHVDNNDIASHVEVMHGDEEDFDGSSQSHGFQEEMMQSLNKIRQDGPVIQPPNLFDIDDDAAFYIKK